MGVSSPVRSPSARLKRIPSRFVVAASASASASVSTPSASIQVPRQLHASGGSTVSTISTTAATVRQSARSQQSASILDQIEEEVDIADELAEEGDESDEEGDDAMMFASHRIDHGDDNFDGVPDVDFNFNDAQFRYRDGSMIDGISEFHFPLHPMGWKPLQPKPHSTCPERFEDIDNPGNWNSYVFTPLYKNKGRFPAKYPKKHPRAGHVHDTAGQVNWEYLYHCLPAGATPVPGTGQVREYKGYKFDYTGKWKVNGDEKTDPFSRSGASKKDPFPKSRNGCLDKDKLKKFGLTRERLMNKDALFFHQLLMPICIPEKSGIDGDERMPYYSKHTKWSNYYRLDITDPGYYHDVKEISVDDMVHFDGIIDRHGALGGGHDIHRRWGKKRGWRKDRKDCKYSKEIDSCMKYSRYLQLKRFLKWNRNDAPENQRHHEDFDVANKFSYVYDVLVKNTKYFTKFACLDQCIDETTFGHGGHGDVIENFRNKMKCRGGQSVLQVDCGTQRVRGVVHRHRYFQKHKEDGYTWRTGSSEVRKLIEENVADEIGPGKLWQEPPHFTMDNFFNQDVLFDYLGARGYGGMGTVARNYLPKGIESKYFHKEETSAKVNAKAARYATPIHIIKEVETGEDNQAYRRVHMTQQSTGALNLGSVNSVSSGETYTRIKSRGIGANKHKRAIEMNPLRDLYLGTYGDVDTIDQYNTSLHIGYRHRKYYHSAVNHAKAFFVITAWSFYKEVVEGDLDPDWKLDKADQIEDIHEFLDILSGQQMKYVPGDKLYPGDEGMRKSTQMSRRDVQQRESTRKKKKQRHISMLTSAGTYSKVGLGSIAENIRNGRLVLSLHDFSKHVKSKFVRRNDKQKPLAKNCVVCGLTTTTYCNLCRKNGKRYGGEVAHAVPLCFFDNKRKQIATPGLCFMKYHMPEHFGLCKDDFNDTDTNKGEWISPTEEEEEQHAKYIQYCMPCMEDVNNNDCTNNSSEMNRQQNQLQQDHHDKNNTNNNNNDRRDDIISDTTTTTTTSNGNNNNNNNNGSNGSDSIEDYVHFPRSSWTSNQFYLQY